MAKELNGKELSLFIKEQQAREVRSLKQSKGVSPKLTIIRTNPNAVTDLYVKLKVAYGKDIGVEVEVLDIDESNAIDAIEELNNNDTVHGIIVQLPLKDYNSSERILNSIYPDKDVDGLGKAAKFDSATATAINWLLSGYNVDLNGKKIVIVGRGKLVGAPLYEIWNASRLDARVVDLDTPDREEIIKSADIIVTATGSPGVIKSDLIKFGAVVVDAGVATQENSIVGDVDPAARERTDILMTPEKGGVGPLTIATLFNNVLVAARKSIS